MMLLFQSRRTGVIQHAAGRRATDKVHFGETRLEQHDTQKDRGDRNDEHARLFAAWFVVVVVVIAAMRRLLVGIGAVLVVIGVAVASRTTATTVIGRDRHAAAAGVTGAKNLANAQHSCCEISNRDLLTRSERVFRLIS